MAMKLDRDTLDRFRTLSPRDAFREARSAVYATGAAGSEDFLNVYNQLVEGGILSWEQVEEFEDRPPGRA
jgi:hypothetical protein